MRSARGEIARLVANMIAHEVPGLARACHAETFFVPHSTMAAWVGGAEKSLMIEGCFLKCHGRVLKKLVGDEKVVHVDALPFYKKYTHVFLMTICRTRSARPLRAKWPTRSSRS